MSARVFTDARQRIDKTSAKNRLFAVVRAVVESLEQRQLLNAQVIPETGPFTPSGSAPLPPLPGVTAYVNSQGASNPWLWSSAITPSTVNDLVLNVTAYAQSYTGCCEGTNSAPGNSGAINAGRLLTNGLTQNQIGAFPFGGAAPAIGSGSNSDASSGASVISQTGGSWWLEYNLGTAPGQTPASNGYDLDEIDVIAGDQTHTSMQADVLVQFAGGNKTDWFSLSNYNNFNFTGLGGGSAQMAIRDPVEAMAHDVRSVKFVAVNQQSYYRELVVTGVPSNSEENFNAPATPVPMVDPRTGAIDVVFGLPLDGAAAYQVQRALVTNGVTGSFSTIAGLVTTTNPMTYTDTTAATGSAYVYQIIKIVNNIDISSGVSNPITTPAVGAEAHFYNMAYWEGPAVVNQGVANVQLNWPTGSAGTGIRNSVNSAAITGKVTPTESGTYTFYSNTDDDGYLYVNGVLVSSEVGLHSPENAGSRLDINDNPIGYAKPVQLTAGTSYNFVLLESNHSGGAAENLVWRTPEGVTEVVPAALLTPISDAPLAPTNLTVATANANFVNFTFTAENNAVVHYTLQRAIAGTTNWTTVDQIDPGSDNFTIGSNLSTATPHQFMTIQDAAPLPGTSYVYRVAAVNFDGFAPTPAVPVNLTLEVAPTGLAVGTYFVAYTWAGDESAVTGESSYVTINTTTDLPTSDAASVVVSGTSDLIVNGFPAAPAGVAGVNVYVGTSPGNERFVGSTSPTGSLVISSLPSASAKALPPAMVNNTALVSGTVAVNVPAPGGANSPGVEIHAYNQELFRRTALPQTTEASGVAQSGPPTEYIAQTTNQSYDPPIFVGPIDRDYSVPPPVSPSIAPSSPDPTPFPDIQRIHTESFSQAFTGALTPGVSGVYTIITNTDDDGYAWVDGTLVSADPGVHGQQNTLFPSPLYPNQPTRTQDTLVPVYLDAGQTYNLTMFMGNTGGNSGAHLTWVEPAPAGSSSSGNVAAAGTSNTGQNGATVSLAGNPLVNQSNYTNYTIFITNGPGAGQAALIANWNNTTKIATVNVITNGSQLLWSTLPTSASQFVVAWVAPVPLQGHDAYPVSSLGGLQLHQDLPVEGTWSPGDGLVSVTTSASAAQNVTITQVSPTAGVSLSWSDAGLSELWFEVQRSTDDTTWTTVGTTPMNVGTTFTDPGATDAFNSPTISYFYRIRGVNFDGAGPFSRVVNTLNDVNIPVPQIANIIQGAPGTAGLVFSGASLNTGGLDVQYATLNNGMTGGFIDATPQGLPADTFDYQVTGLVPSQRYVFTVRNLPGGNDGTGTIFSDAVAFTPSGGVQENFGTPGTGVGGFTSGGDLVLNGNASFTGPGIPAPATPASSPLLATSPDLANPSALATFTISADAPAPTDAGTFSTSTANLGLSGASSVYLEYTWVTATGETLPFSTPVSFSIPSGSSVLLTYTVPTAPVGFGITNANIYIGTNPSLSSQTLEATVTPGQSIITSFPTSYRYLPVVSTAGVPAGTYYVRYTWSNAANQQTAGSPEQTVVATNLSNDLLITLPPAPAGATNSNIYIGTAPGGEKLKVSTVASAPSILIRGLAFSGAASVPTTNAAGLAAGIYYVRYSWNTSLPYEYPREGLASPMSSIVVATGQDLLVSIPAAPAGTSNANIYIGTSPTTLSSVGESAGGTTFVLQNFISYADYPAIFGTVTTGPAQVTLYPDPLFTPPTKPLAILGTQSYPGSQLVGGTVYLQYTWLGNGGTNGNGGGGESAASAEQTIAIPAGPNELTIQVPLPAGNADFANIYIGTSPGSERLLQPAYWGSILYITRLPPSNAPVAPMTSTIGIPTGTYYLSYTWTSDPGLETAGSPEQTITVGTSGNDLYVTPPAPPIDADNYNIYLGTAPGQEFYAETPYGGVITSVPSINQKIVPTTSSQNLALYTPANALQILSNNASQQGTAFNSGENINGFKASFDFAVTGDSGGDDFGIVFTPDVRALTGAAGSGISYDSASPPMQHSAGIFFRASTNTSDPYNLTGLAVNGMLPSQLAPSSGWIDLTKTAGGAPSGVVPHVGDAYNVTLYYDNIHHILTETVYDVTLKNRGVNNGFSTSYSIDLVATIGMASAYVGFVKTTPLTISSETDILNFSFSNPPPIQLDTITGIAGVDQITLTQDPDHLHIDWTINGVPQLYQEAINSPQGLTINGNGSNDVITLDYTNGDPLPNKLSLNGVFTLNNLAATGNPLANTTIDLENSTLFINYGAAADPLSLIKGYLKTGYNTGTWTGTSAGGSILSSSAAAAPMIDSIGYADSADVANPANLPANTLELRYTVIGDTNLDGTVGLADLAALLKSYGSGTKWDQGEVSYGTTVGLADLAALLKHYGQTASSPAALPTMIEASSAASVNFGVSEPDLTPTTAVAKKKAVLVKSRKPGRMHKSTIIHAKHRNAAG